MALAISCLAVSSLNLSRFSDSWPFRHHFLAARRQHCFECFDAVVGRFEKEILYHGLGALELIDQHLCVDLARHDAADLCLCPVAERLPEDHDSAALAGLREIFGRFWCVLLPGRFPLTRPSGGGHVDLLSAVMPP